MELFETVKGLLYIAGLYAAMPFQGAILGVMSVFLIGVRFLEIIGIL